MVHEVLDAVESGNEMVHLEVGCVPGPQHSADAGDLQLLVDDRAVGARMAFEMAVAGASAI